MKHLSTVASAALISLALAQGAVAQDMPPRAIGSLDVDAATTAPLQVTRSVHLDAAPETIFATIADNENWVSWFDSLESVEGQDGSRTFTFTGGQGALTENIVAFDEPSVFAWSISEGNPLGLENHLGALHVMPDAEDGEGSVVSLSVFYNHPDLAGIAPVTEGGGATITDALVSVHGGSVTQEVFGTDKITIRTTRVTDASVAELWGVMVDGFGDVAQWSSVISEATLFGETGTSNDGLLGVGRKCFIPGFGSEVEERVVEVNREAGRFAYEVLAGLPPFASNGLSQWEFEDLGDGTTRVTSTITMDIAEGTPGMALGMTKAQFGQLMTMSIDEFVHFVRTGEPHPRELASRS
ncbi:SRPBCC family protein [uncultured Roseobacter sp.]|uniref:SRPBCC family protein n=1 Tax=uncultured Roseobacter sp. TaxID=114847 RepID=UPI002609113D|nr:SRPBCC family protein [uncultured Roseobacter sp.]